MIDIRPAQAQDIPALRKIAIETQIDTFAEFNTPENMEAFLRESYSSEQLGREFQEPGPPYFIAWDDTTPVGFMRLRICDEVEDRLGKNTIELQRLYVVKSFHGKKVGAQLMKHALTYAKENKYDWLWLGVWERNFKAQEFYKRLGFERFSEHVFMMGTDPQTDWLLKLKL